MEHLALEIFNLTDSKTSITALGSQYANLPEDASITITETSEIFESGNVWSHSFTLNVHANAHIFGTAGDIHGSRLHDQIDHRRARLWVDDLPLFLGYLRLGDEAEVDDDGNVDVSFESGQHTFDDLIEGAKANQVPMMSDVRFGLALWRKRWTCINVQLEATAYFNDGSKSAPAIIRHTVQPSKVGDEDEQLTRFECDDEYDDNSVQQYPRMVFPKGKFYNLKTGETDEEIDCLNTDYPYDDAHPYCNVALCYQKSGYKKKNPDGSTYDDYSSDPEAERGYEVMPANRVNSAPNFYVIYWLRCLMKHLGIYIDENQMMDVEDLRRLFFVNSNCAYEELSKLRTRNESEWPVGVYRFGSDGSLVAEYFGDLQEEKYEETVRRYDILKKITKQENSRIECKGFTEGRWYDYDEEQDVTDQVPEIDHIDVKIKGIAGMSEAVKRYYETHNRYLHDAIATSDCFPNVDISEVIRAIESGFGIRFLFDRDYQRVRIVLLRNIFRSQDVQDIQCEIVGEPTKTENSIRGFRMTYGNTDDTHFYYKGFADKLPHKKELWVDDSDKHDYSHWKLDAKYEDLLDNVSAFDKTCYVDPKTGDAYIIKVDKDAKRMDDLYPSLFGCADFMDAEDGDCTGEEETIETVNVGFKPAIMNDVNYERQRGDSNTKNQQFALFVDKQMRPRRPDLGDLPKVEKPDVKSYNDSDAMYSVDELYAQHGPNSDAGMTKDGLVAPGSFVITSDTKAELTGLSLELTHCYRLTPWGGMYIVPYYAKCQFTNLHLYGHINEGYLLYLQDNYEPNDDGICPIEEQDWGLTLGIMRGSGSDAHVGYSGDPDDGEDNDTWEIVPGSSATAHPDTCDNYGNEWDYNGTGTVNNAGDAIAIMQEMWPDSNYNLIYSSGTTLRNGDTYISGIGNYTVKDSSDNTVRLLFAAVLGNKTQTYTGSLSTYARKFKNMTKAEMYAYDAAHQGILIEACGAADRLFTLQELQKIAFLPGYVSTMILDSNGVGSRYGRFSLKLRAEKLNPYYVAGSTEDGKSNQYLDIDDKNLRRRGLCDQFYKEYSFWIRNARIANLPVRMELAQLLAIDKTKKTTVGDITGFIRKMQYTVNNKTGLGDVTMEVMYI